MPVGGVEITVLGVLTYVDQIGSGLVRLRHPAMACKHVPDRARYAGRCRDVTIEVLVMAAPERNAVIVDDYRSSVLRFRHSLQSLHEQGIRRHVEHSSSVIFGC